MDLNGNRLHAMMSSLKLLLSLLTTGGDTVSQTSHWLRCRVDQIDTWQYMMTSSNGKTNSALLAICTGNSPAIGEFRAQRPVTRSFNVFFDLRLNTRLIKQSWGCWFETHRTHYAVTVMKNADNNDRVNTNGRYVVSGEIHVCAEICFALCCFQCSQYQFRED